MAVPLALGIMGIILAQWKAVLVTTGENALLATYASQKPLASLVPNSPSKEYIYAGSKLLATEEPTPIPSPTGSNVALATNGGVASASSQYSAAYAPGGANNGDRRGINWQTGGGGWADDPSIHFPEWLQIDFSGNKTINEIDVFTLQDGFATLEPTETMTFTQYGIIDFDIQFWNGSAWVTVPNGSVTGNDQVWRKFTFSPITTGKIRVTVNAARLYHSRIVEVEAWATN